jgi:hypothetical protein
MLINMCFDVAAYPGFCLFALGVCILVIMLDGMWYAQCNNKSNYPNVQLLTLYTTDNIYIYNKSLNLI